MTASASELSSNKSHNISDWNQVVIYDGECRFCQGSVEWILRHEKDKTLRFAWLQSEKTIAFIESLSLAEFPDSLILVQDDQVFFKSEAAIRISMNLKAPYSWIRIFSIIPTFIRNGVYDLISSNRIELMGGMSCTLPQGKEERFVDGSS